MASGRFSASERPMRLLAVTQGVWGDRIADNIQRHRAANWVVHRWAAPPALPLVVEDAESYITSLLPQVDLLLAMGEQPGLAQLIPEIARLTGAQSVLAAIDRNESMPPGLVRQLRGWLEGMGVNAVFPKPFCSLEVGRINRAPVEETYSDPWVEAFAASFGRPGVSIDVEGGRIIRVDVVRDSACGCARYVAEGLLGCPVDEAGERAGMLHHHFPCLASMNIDSDYRDTLMHVSGNYLKDEVEGKLREHVPLQYLRPHGHVEEG